MPLPRVLSLRKRSNNLGLLAQPAEKGKPVTLIFAHFSTGENPDMPVVATPACIQTHGGQMGLFDWRKGGQKESDRLGRGMVRHVLAKRRRK